MIAADTVGASGPAWACTAGAGRPSMLAAMTQLARTRRETARPDDRPPICPACGVTMGIVTGENGAPRFVCLECGFPDHET